MYQCCRDFIRFEIGFDDYKIIKIDIQVQSGEDSKIIIIDGNEKRIVDSAIDDYILHFHERYSNDCLIQLYEIN